MKTWRSLLLLSALALLLGPGAAFGYIGPGAGFALAGSFMAVAAAILSAALLLITWPVRMLWRLVFGWRGAQGRYRRVIVLGLDGLDHGLTRKLLAEGKLPNLARLAGLGCFSSLGSTLPPISPVAWSTFQTGVNPGKHNIFDFLVPDHRTYQPKLSSVEILPPRNVLKLGPYHFPLSGADIRLLRKSQPFWKLLGDIGVFSSILRVPITWPPEEMRGVLLSAMCVPDLRGTQGTFSLFTTRSGKQGQKTGGEVSVVRREGDTVRGELVGPTSPFRPDQGAMKAPFSVRITGPGTATLSIGDENFPLVQGQYTEWAPVVFNALLGISVRGVARFLLLETEPEFELYVTPINIDPEEPAMPLGHPSVYPIYLAKQQGPYATLGLAEDTWALNEHVLEDVHFVRQCADIDAEREKMFFDALDKTPAGLCVCVFDGTDRMQHMFWRYLDESHPARPAEVPDNLATVIEDLYRRMDGLVGRTMEKCHDGDLLLVISDHGFNSFRRGVDLNRWLEENGYLVVDEARRNEEYLAGVDWSRTRAFAIGLTGIFINEKGKYEQGIVSPGEEAERLREEVATRLAAVIDPQTGEKAVRRVYQAVKAYKGPYKEQAPDLIVGYESGYRISWDAAVGRASLEVFSDNNKAWSGDHCVDPSVVPGVLFCNQPIHAEAPRLLDLAPTILSLFGVPPPDYMDGKVWQVGPMPDAPPPPPAPAKQQPRTEVVRG